MLERAPTRSFQTTVNFQSRSAEKLGELISGRFTPIELEPLGSCDLFSVSGTYNIFAGIICSQSKTVGDLRMIPHAMNDGVLFSFASAGSMVIGGCRENLINSPTTAIAVEGATYRSSDLLSNHASRSIRIDRSSLIARVSVLLGRPIVEPLTFQLDFDTRSNSANTLSSVVTFVTEPALGLELTKARRAAERIRETLIDLLLETWPNSYLDILNRPQPSISPRHVKLAVDYIRDHAETIPTGTELAALSGVSLRSLQSGFRRFMGISIAAYQRQVRLERAHSDLLSDPAASIETIALRWGFTNAGRFSRYFRAAYGVFPAELDR